MIKKLLCILLVVNYVLYILSISKISNKRACVCVYILFPGEPIDKHLSTHHCLEVAKLSDKCNTLILCPTQYVHEFYF